MTQHATSPKKKSETTESTTHFQEALGKTIEAINNFGAARRLINPPSDKLTKARQEIAQYFHDQFRTKPSVSKALDDLSREKLTLSRIDLSSVGAGISIPQLKPAGEQPIPATIVRRDAPYDDAWVWGNQGKHEKNKDTGLLGIWGSCGGVSQADVPDQDADHLDGATGITVIVTTDKPASVQVTATVLNHWQYLSCSWRFLPCGHSGRFGYGSLPKWKPDRWSSSRYAVQRLR